MFSTRQLLCCTALLLIGLSPLSAQEVCGLSDAQFENLLANGFEDPNATSNQAVSAKSAPKQSPEPSPLRPLRIVAVPKSLKVAPTLTITSPANGASIPGGYLQVRGTFTGDSTVGISINGVPAYIVGNAFVSPPITIAPSATAGVEAIATNLAGETATQSRSVDTTVVAPKVTLETTRGATFRDLDIDFRVVLATEEALLGITLDFNNDGTPEFSGTDPALAPQTFRYAAPGIYTARVTITTSAGTASFDRQVAILDFEQHRTRPCTLYGILRDRLTQNDVPGALRVFPQEYRARYQTLFNALGTNRPTMATRLGTIANGIYGLSYAEIYVVFPENGIEKATPLRVDQGTDGVWRIESL